MSSSLEVVPLEYFSLSDDAPAEPLAGRALVTPALTVANVPQHACEQLVRALALSRIGAVEHPDLLPLVYAEPSGVALEAELFATTADDARGVAVLQRRAPTREQAGASARFAAALVDWALAGGATALVLAHSVDDASVAPSRRPARGGLVQWLDCSSVSGDSETAPAPATTTTTTNTTALSRLAAALRQRSPGGELRDVAALGEPLGFTRHVVEACAAKRFPLLVVSMSAAEGAADADAAQAEPLSALLAETLTLA